MYPILSFLIFVWPVSGLADDIDLKTEPPPQTMLDIRKQHAEKVLNESGKTIDRFITQRILRKPYEDISDTSANARLTVETGYFENGKFKSDVDFNISLILPTAKKHLRLFAGGEESYFKNNKNSPLTNAEKRLENTDMQAGLQYTFNAIKRWNPRLRSGVKFRKNQLDPFTELKFKRQIGTDEHHLWLSQAGRYSRLQRMVYTTQMDYFKKLAPDWDFRFANQFQLDQPTHNWSYQHSPIFTHSFSTQGHWVNQLTIKGQEGELKAYTQAILSTRIIHPIFRPWILLEIESVHTHSLIDNEHNNALFLRTHFLFNR